MTTSFLNIIQENEYVMIKLCYDQKMNMLLTCHFLSEKKFVVN